VYAVASSYCVSLAATLAKTGDHLFFRQTTWSESVHLLQEMWLTKGQHLRQNRVTPVSHQWQPFTDISGIVQKHIQRDNP
jgi:hypothetical protein